MLYNLGKKIFGLLIELVRFLQVVLIFLSFFIILYWILQIAGVEFIKPVAPFFEGIKAFIHIFYNRQVQIDNVTVDFSFLLATFLVLALSWELKFLIEFIEYGENHYDRIYEYLKNKYADSFNKNLEKQYLLEEYKNNKFILLIKIKAENLLQDKFFEKDSSVDVEKKEKEILEDFLNNLDKNLIYQRKSLKGKILLYFSNFDDIEKVLFSVEKNIKNLKQKYNEMQWRISTFVSIEVYADVNENELKIERLETLIKLGLNNKIICLATFNQRYSLKKNPQYIVEPCGVYTIMEDENVFQVKRLYKST